MLSGILLHGSGNFAVLEDYITRFLSNFHTSRPHPTTRDPASCFSDMQKQVGRSLP